MKQVKGILFCTTTHTLSNDNEAATMSCSWPNAPKVKSLKDGKHFEILDVVVEVVDMDDHQTFWENMSSSTSTLLMD